MTRFPVVSRHDAQHFEGAAYEFGNDSGYVYFIQSALGGTIKIGTSEDPGKRLAQLQLSSPLRLQIVGALEGLGVMSERRLHLRLRAHRLHGEWFDNAPGVLQALEKALSLSDLSNNERTRRLEIARRRFDELPPELQLPKPPRALPFVGAEWLKIEQVEEYAGKPAVQAVYDRALPAYYSPGARRTPRNLRIKKSDLDVWLCENPEYEPTMYLRKPIRA